MKIAITGGKGGTGKSTIATALAVELAKKYKVILVDADVECPDDHIILSIKRKILKDVKAFLPLFNDEKCLKCGKCSDFCKENAIIQLKDKIPFVLEGQCNGCEACFLICPNEAISNKEQIIGSIYHGSYDFDSENYGKLILISGEMSVGCKTSSPVVAATLDFVSTLEKYDFLLIDTAAGTHCNVITALMGADLALAVTEPTPFGKHDLNIILKLLNLLKIKSEIIINKSDMGDLSLIKELKGSHDINIISEIPYTKRIIKSYSEGTIIADEKISEISKLMEQIL